MDQYKGYRVINYLNLTFHFHTVPLLGVGSVSVYARVQWWEPDTGQQKVQWWRLNTLPIWYIIYLCSSAKFFGGGINAPAIPKVIDFPWYNMNVATKTWYYAEYFAWYLSRFPLHFVLYRENLYYILDSVRNAMFTLSILTMTLQLQ